MMEERDNERLSKGGLKSISNSLKFLSLPLEVLVEVLEAEVKLALIVDHVEQLDNAWRNEMKRVFVKSCEKQLRGLNTQKNLQGCLSSLRREISLIAVEGT